MSIRLLVNDEVAYEGDAIPIPRVGDHLRQQDDAFQIEAVTWDLSAATIVVSLVVAKQPYTV